MRKVLTFGVSLVVILAAAVFFTGGDVLWGEEKQEVNKEEQTAPEKKEVAKKEEPQKVEAKKEEPPKKEPEAKGEPKEVQKPAKEEPKLFTSKGKSGKNLQIMAIDSITDLQNTMKTITKSLGADCKFCHILTDFSKDEKTLKKDMARKMLTMTDEINGKYFKEMNLKIACVTCHHGRKEPILSLEDWEKMKSGETAVQPDTGKSSAEAKPKEATKPAEAAKPKETQKEK